MTKNILWKPTVKRYNSGYRVFFESFTAAQGKAKEERNAEERFKAGVAHARHIRDRAVALLQQVV